MNSIPKSKYSVHDFECYIPNLKRGEETQIITISKRSICFSRKIIKNYFKEKKFVKIGYNKEKCLLLLCPIDTPKNALKLNNSNTIIVTTFYKRFNINIKNLKKYTVLWNEECSGFIVSIKDQIIVGTLKNGKWSLKYNSCINCETTSIPHASRGLCKTCLSIEKEKSGYRLQNGKWSLKHDKCINCGSDESPHKAYGLCCSCYKKDSWNKKKLENTLPTKEIN